ncbi:hypothetical protein EON64_18605, partial [archaeon]
MTSVKALQRYGGIHTPLPGAANKGGEGRQRERGTLLWRDAQQPTHHKAEILVSRHIDAKTSPPSPHSRSAAVHADLPGSGLRGPHWRRDATATPVYPSSRSRPGENVSCENPRRHAATYGQFEVAVRPPH